MLSGGAIPAFTVELLQRASLHDQITAASSIVRHGSDMGSRHGLFFGRARCEWKTLRTHYLIFLWFVRKVTQAVGGQVPVGGGWATCRKVGIA